MSLCLENMSSALVVSNMSDAFCPQPATTCGNLFSPQIGPVEHPPHVVAALEIVQLARLRQLEVANEAMQAQIDGFERHLTFINEGGTVCEARQRHPYMGSNGREYETTVRTCYEVTPPKIRRYTEYGIHDWNLWNFVFKPVWNSIGAPFRLIADMFTTCRNHGVKKIHGHHVNMCDY